LRARDHPLPHPRTARPRPDLATHQGLLPLLAIPLLTTPVPPLGHPQKETTMSARSRSLAVAMAAASALALSACGGGGGGGGADSDEPIPIGVIADLTGATGD